MELKTTQTKHPSAVSEIRNLVQMNFVLVQKQQFSNVQNSQHLLSYRNKSDPVRSYQMTNSSLSPLHHLLMLPSD